MFMTFHMSLSVSLFVHHGLITTFSHTSTPLMSYILHKTVWSTTNDQLMNPESIHCLMSIWAYRLEPKNQLA